MIVKKAYKYRIYPNKEQREYFEKVFGCVRFYWNKALELKLKEPKSYVITPAKLKPEYHFLKEADSLALANAQLQLNKALRDHYKNPKHFRIPRYKSKRNPRQSFTTNNQNGTVKINFENNRMKIPKLKTAIRAKLHREFSGQIKSVTISKTKTGKYYASVLVETEVMELKQAHSACGIDVGIKDFAVITKGNNTNKKCVHVDNPKHLEKAEKRLVKLQHQLSRKQHPEKRGDKTPFSNNYLRQKKRIAKLHEHVSNQRKDFLHKLSKTIVDESQAIVVEDLNVKGMLKNHHLAKEISSVSWSKFIEMLRYKSEWYGRKLIKADRFYPSSQICSVCGYRNPLVKDLSIREWVCPVCKTRHNRDENASANLWQIGIDYLKSVGQELPEFTPVERDNVDERMATYLKSEPSLKQEAPTSTSGR